MIIDAFDLVTNPLGNKPQDAFRVIGIAIHHTVGNNAVQDIEGEKAAIRAIDRQHVDAGYGGFGYHYIVFPSGRAYHCGEGQRAHVAKRNHELRGIALSGTFTDMEPSYEQLRGVREVLIREAYYGSDIRGHREWALPGEGTVCPGMVVPRDWAALLRDEVPAGVGAHYTDGSDEEIWTPRDGKVLDGIGVRFEDGTIRRLWPNK